jgi:cytochrome P450
LENLNDDGILPYEKINELQYLDQMFYENFRLHSPFMFTTKVCSEEIELEGVKGHKVMIKKGSTAMISFHSIHLDSGEFKRKVLKSFKELKKKIGLIHELKSQNILKNC